MPQKRPKEGQQVPGRGQGVRAGGEGAHLGHDASLVQEEAAEACGFLGDGVSVEPCQALPQRQLLGLGVFGGCPGVAGQ